MNKGPGVGTLWSAPPRRSANAFSLLVFLELAGSPQGILGAVREWNRANANSNRNSSS
jgi:hypothetical protein